MRTFVTALLAVLLTMNATVLVRAQTTAPGEHMIVVLNYIKAEKRAQFDDYLKRFQTDLRKVIPNDRTRFLKPVAANEDGTLTYVFLIQPVVKGGDYSMLSVLTKSTSKEEAERRMKQFLDCLAKPQVAAEVQN